MKKNAKLHIPISTEQKDKLIARAQVCGLSLSSYCLLVLLNSKPIVHFEEKLD
jgi:hypothetical protein